jgi:vacuolar-type H+-ATPase subunit I/STV1
MSKPEKPQHRWENYTLGHWDANEAEAEIKRLRKENQNYEAMKQGVIIRITDLEEDNKRLRELLRECRHYVGAEMVGVTEVSLRDRIEKELSDD